MATQKLSVLTGVQVVQPVLWGPDVYTPSAPQGFGTLPPANIALNRRRVGSYLLISGRFQVGTPTAVEGRLDLGTYNGTTLIIGTYGGNSINASVGKWMRNNASATTFKQGVVLASSGTTYLTFGVDDYTIANNPGVALSGSSIANASEFIYFDGEIAIPIQGWDSYTTYGSGYASDVTPGLLKYYKETTSTVAVSGATTAPNCVARITRSGNMVTVLLPSIGSLLKNGSAGSLLLTSIIPAGFRPTAQQNFINYSCVSGNMSAYAINSAGSIQQYTSASGNIAAGGACGWDVDLSFSYVI